MSEMSERPRPARADELPGPLPTPALPRSLDEMPPALLARSRSRLSLVALGASLFMFAGTVLQIGLYVSVGRQSIRYGPGIDLVSALLCLLLFATVRSKRLRDQTALRAGLALQIALCTSLFLFSFINELMIYGRLASLTWGTVVMLLFPLLVPLPPRTLLACVVAEALAGPAALLAAQVVASVIEGREVAFEHLGAALLTISVHQAFAAFVALAGSRVLWGASVDVRDLELHRGLLAAVVEHAGAAVVISDEAGRVAFLNDQARRQLGVGAARELTLEALLSAQPAGLREAWGAGRDVTASYQGAGGVETVQIVRRDLSFGRRPLTLWVLRPLTEALRGREAGAYKRLIRVFVHELNNSLGALTSMVRTARLALHQPGKAHLLERTFDQLERSADKVAGFFDRYARLARLPAPRLEPVDWAEFLSLLAQQASFRLDAPAPEGGARFDPTQLRQVLLNLIKNAHESGGPPGEVSLRAFADEGGVAIEVADRGAGLSAEARELAFTPFFSTKPQGTGLGLSVSAEILEAHGGRLVLLAREGGGTVARCWLSCEPSG
jgi:two-component system, NtrC family, nitrogen regulation sensor histidine kinase NtrY